MPAVSYLSQYRIFYGFLSIIPKSAIYIDRILKKDIYQYLIDKCNPVIKHVPAKYIAEFIGITAEWYSKLKR